MADEIEAAGYDARIVRNWTVPQGADTVNQFRPFHIVADAPVYYDLTAPGWSARSQMRIIAGDAVIWVEFLSTSTIGPRIELDADGWLSVVLPAATTEDPAWNERTSGAYDVELVTPDGETIRLAKGKVKVKPDVTRSP